MFFGYFLLTVAISISTVSAYYSISGLTAIFSGAVIPIIIMGSALEIGKISATVWLHKYWDRASIQFKLYLIPAIAGLMLITSMGIFGLLSKSHVASSEISASAQAKVQIFDDKIATEKENIASAKQSLAQLDKQVNEVLSRSTNTQGASKSVQIRKQQVAERKQLDKIISGAQTRIEQLQADKAPLATSLRTAESDIGPIKYIAAMIYGDKPDAAILEKAVRAVILIIVFVFDPLALVLILAAEQTLVWTREDKEKKDKLDKAMDEALNATKSAFEVLDEQRLGWHREWVPDRESWPEWDDTITDKQYEAIKQEANVDDNIVMQEFFAIGKEIAKEVDANNGYLNKEWKRPANSSTVGLVPEINTPAGSATDAIAEQVEKDYNEYIEETSLIAVTDHLGNPIGTYTNSGDASNVHVDHLGNPITTLSILPNSVNFGSTLPLSANKGDQFIKIDSIPHRLFKWNGDKWINVDKTINTSYSFNDAYIQYLVDSVGKGEYDAELLTDNEQEQITKFIDR